MSSKFQFTKTGFEALQNEYSQIDQKLAHTAKRLEEARLMGDLRENSEYHAAKDDLAEFNARKLELEAILKQAVVAEDESASSGVVGVGKTVTVKTPTTQITYMIVGDFEADPLAKKLSPTSPIGQALSGKKKGDKVSITIPAGVVEYEIIEVT